MKTKNFYSRMLILFIGLIFGFSQISYSQTYCIPTVQNYANYGMGMTNVTMGTPGVNGFTNNTTAEDGVHPVYNAYLNLVVSALPGGNVSVSVTNGGGNNTEVYIFIDWNNDGTFNTSGNELVFTSNNITAGAVVTGNFTVPSGLTCGPRRIRVSGDFGSLMPGNPPTPCANYYGEFEDYTFMVLFSGGTPTLDVAMQGIFSPAVFKTGSNPLTVSYISPGSTTVNTANFGYILDNGTPVKNSGVSTGGLTGCQQQVKQYTFPTSLSLTPGNHKLTAWVNTPNGTYPDNNINNDSMKFTFCTTTSGSFVIDAAGTGDFKTFNAALNSLTCGGLNGPISFTVKPGTYNERVVIPAIYGMSKTNTITFDGLNKANVTLTWSGTAMATRSTVVLNGASYVTFKNMTISNTSSSYACGVVLTNVARNNNFINCSIITPASSSGNIVSILATASESGNNSGGDIADSNNFTNNLISGGCYGAYMNGNAGNTPCYFNNFIGNTFTNQYQYGLYNYYQGNSTIQYNTFTSFTYTGAYAYYGYMNTQTNFDANIINPGEYGLYMEYENEYFTGNKSYITNNMIYNFSNTSYQVGLYFQYFDYGLNILHNSIWVNGNAAYNGSSSYQYAAIFFNYYQENPIVKNNILVSTGTTMLISGMYYPQANANIDYNDYYYPNSTSDKFYWYTGSTTSISYPNLTLFKLNTMNITPTHDANSFDQINPNFISATNLHLNSAYAPIYVTNLGITHDVDGNTRCTISPTIGADESNYPYPKPNARFTSYDTTYTGLVTDFLSSTTASVPYSYQWYLNGAAVATTYNYSKTFTTTGTDAVAYVVKGCFVQDSFVKNVIVAASTRPPKALFTTNANAVNVNDNVIFKDLSLYGPQNWTWTITPALSYDPISGLMMPTYQWATGSTLHSENPTLQFLVAGTYTLQLSVSNLYGSDSLILSNFIMVKPSLNMCYDEIADENYGTLTDDGGPSGNYSILRDCSFLLTPCSPNLTITIQSFVLGTGAYLRIYDGIDTNGIPVYNTTTYPKGFTGTLGANTNFTSTTGKFFFRFITGSAATAAGFVITWVAEPVVTTGPKASFVIPDTICVGKNYIFKNTSTGYGNEYFWDINNDGIIESQNYQVNFGFNYTAPYSDKVILIATNCGGSDTFSKFVVAQIPVVAPHPGFYANNVVPAKNAIVSLTDTSYNCVDTWIWSFSNPKHVHYQNGTNMNSQNPQVSFDSAACYDVKLYVSSNGYADSLTKSCYIDVLNYCIPVVTIPSTDIGISNVTIGTINNSSQINNTTYTDYTNTQFTNIVKTVPTAITISRLTQFNNMSIAVWIDLNRDGVFESNELVASIPSFSGLQWTGYITIPLSQPNITTRMRIGTNITPLANKPCGPNKNGEFEDYEVQITGSTGIPVITLNGPDTMNLERGYTFKDPGAVAIDPLQGNISSNLIIKSSINKWVLGTYHVKYDVTDSFGNPAKEVIRTIIVTPDVTPPVITLTGGDTINWNVNSPWVEPGFTAIDYPLGTILTSKVIVTGFVKINVVGPNVLTYTVVDSSGNKGTIKRLVNVKDIMPPTIKLLGNTIMYIEVYNSFKDPGYTATDNYWKNLKVIVSNSVDTAVVGTYILTYNCTDSSGNKSTPLTRTVYVEDTIKPVITLKGSDTMQVPVGTPYVELGATVTDNYCLLSHNVKISGTINSNVLGTYILNYDIADCEGNQAITVHRYVQVIDNIAPIITLIGVANRQVYRWQSYIEEGYTVSDNFWPRNKIQVDTLGNFVNTNFTGLYTIQYKATDGSGNVGYSAIRTIEVDSFRSGINTNVSDNWIKVYPNPSNGIVNVTLNLPQEENISLVVYDIYGKELVRIYDGNMQNQVFNLDLSGYSKGMYFLKLKAQDKQLIQKIIIN